jgi:creatinine amidohydrolase
MASDANPPTPPAGQNGVFPIDLAAATFAQVAEAAANLLVILPVGATEAHGPHLPLSTDVIISTAMARRGAELLREAGILAAVAPALAYTAAGFAQGFAGTISVKPETVTALIDDIALGLEAHGVRTLVLANAHLDPTHIGSLRAAQKQINARGQLRALFPDVTRKPWALRLTDEFKSGACHAGQYEGSVVMAERPDLVNDPVRARLAPNPSSLSTAIREGKNSFESAGGPDAYFGDPAAATAEEGRATIQILGEIVRDAVVSAD